MSTLKISKSYSSYLKLKTGSQAKCDSKWFNLSTREAETGGLRVLLVPGQLCIHSETLS
jgi:hypothetical protein